MVNKNITLPYNIGDIVYLVENFNEYYDKTRSYMTKYGGKVTIKILRIEAFIIDEEGIHIAEDSHDGYNKITTYHNLTLDRYGDCKIFTHHREALDYVKSIL